MKLKRYIFITILAIAGIGISCRDESLYPLPYDDREVGAYMRLYSLSSNVFDLNNLANSGLDAVFEAVDGNGGNDLAELRIFVRHRRGTALTSEVAVKTIPASDFSDVPEPTYSEYRRARVRVTANETLAALAGATGFPGSLLAADQIIYRSVMVLTDGREFTNTNTTPNITGGQFYSASFLYTLVVRALTANTWLGNFSLTQTAIWSPNHSPALHASAQFPAYLNQVLFPNQTVNLSIPAGGLSTEREFSVNYRGQTVTMRINLENGTVYVPLQNSTVNCTSERQLYWTQPAGGSFAGSSALQAGLPQVTTPNVGSYNVAQGAAVGNILTIGVDDDADEYGRRNGYCTWVRRVRLTLTKL
jgi:hypothetical protein